MAIVAKRLIPTCTGARLLLPGAFALVFCLSVGVCQDLSKN